MKRITLQGGAGRVALVDDGDFEDLNRYTWLCFRIRTKEYAGRSDASEGKKRLLLLHRVVMGAQKGDIVDHRNGDGLDCRKENMRFCTASQNAANRKVLRTGKTSRYRGVRLDWRKPRWIAEVRHHNKTKHLGYFNDEREAALAYNVMALRCFGEFAQLNEFPSEDVPGLTKFAEAA